MGYCFGDRYKVGYRIYDDKTGRWMSIDPIGFEGGLWNLYGYVGNNPVRYFDPSGLWHPALVGCGVGVAIGTVTGLVGGIIGGNTLCKVGCYSAGGCLVGAAAGLLAPLIKSDPVIGVCISGFLGSLGASAVQNICNGVCDKCPVNWDLPCIFVMAVIDGIIGCASGAVAEQLLTKAQVLLGITTSSLNSVCAQKI